MIIDLTCSPHALFISSSFADFNRSSENRLEKKITCTQKLPTDVNPVIIGHNLTYLLSPGHGADVKCVDWHPQKSLVASGSKDTQQPLKLWDPRMGESLATMSVPQLLRLNIIPTFVHSHAHKHTVMEVSFNRNGNWLLTASRDHLLKLFDIRNMKEELQSFRGHKKEATSQCQNL